MKRSAAVVSLNLKMRRDWARSNHRTGVKRWAVARAVFLFSAQDAQRGCAQIQQSNFCIRHFDCATGETR